VNSLFSPGNTVEHHNKNARRPQRSHEPKTTRADPVLVPGIPPAPQPMGAQGVLRLMIGKDVYEDPSRVKAVEGKVEVQGPDSVSVTLTPEAAEETSDRLLTQSLKARGQKQLANNPHQPAE
jgi:hypothetical protein